MRAFFREHTGKFCARRILGTFGFLCCIAAIFARIQHPLLEPLMWSSTGLIGLTTADVFSVQAGHKHDGGV